MIINWNPPKNPDLCKTNECKVYLATVAMSTTDGTLEYCVDQFPGELSDVCKTEIKRRETF